MEFFDTLYRRKTVRNYTGEAVIDVQLAKILKAAQASPIGLKRYDTLHMTVIRNKAFLDKWEQKVYAETGRMPFYGAPTLILISSMVGETPYDNVNYSNAAIMAQNMALAACELGLGACHIWGAVRTLNESPELLSELKIPEGMRPVCSVIVGVTDETYEERDVPDRITTVYFD